MPDSVFIHNSHNVSNLVYHFVCPTKIITTIKSITAKCIFAEHPEVKKQLWGGSFWSGGFFVSSCGKNTSEKTIKEYVKNQGKQDSYEQILLKL